MIDAIPDDLSPELSQYERQLALRLGKALKPKHFETQVNVWRACIDLAAQLDNVHELARLVAAAEGRPLPETIYGPRIVYSLVSDFNAVGYADR